jgi:hypothetical protein
MPDDLLSKPIRRPQGEIPLSDALRGSGGAHSINHSSEVERALGNGQ